MGIHEALRRALGKDKLRSLGVILALGAALAIFLSQVNKHYLIEEWLFWHYASYWLVCLAWVACVFGIGELLLRRVFRLELPFLERMLTTFALGSLGFYFATFLLGVCQGYRPIAFFLLPIVLIALAQKEYPAIWRRCVRVFRARPMKRSPYRFLGVAFGFIGLLMVYFLVLTPDNIQFDSRWKHMALAEDYAAHGGIRRSTEGWLFAARPHLVSYLYSWAFLIPSPRLFDKMLLCAHLEYVSFLISTVLGIPVLVRRLVPKADPTVVWAARFLFPGVLLYDSSVSGGTDHFGAAFAAPIAVALLGVLRDLDPRRVALLATLLAGPILIKETAALLLVPFPVLALGARWLQDLWRRRRAPEKATKQKPWLVPAIGLGVGLVVTSPLWLQNLLLYGDPLYPTLAKFFPARPWSEAAAYRFKWYYAERQMWAPPRTWDGFVETLKTLFTYSFDPNDWKALHKNVPVFGSLFTLLLLPLPFLRKTGRIWLMVGWVHLGIFAWYMVHHQDRYLQGIVPVMSAVVAAVLIAIFRSAGALAKVAASLVVVAQVVWGGDVYFFQTHSMARSPIKKVVDLLGSGFHGDHEARFDVERSMVNIGNELPKGARVLMHEVHPHLGLGHESVLDNYPWQYGLEYGAQGSPEGVRALLRKRGITHVHYSPGKANGIATFAGAILFQEFMDSVATNARRVSGGILAAVPEEPTTAPFNDSVAVLTCNEVPPRGLYALKSLDVLAYGPKGEDYGATIAPAETLDDAVRLLDEAEYAIVETRCFRGQSPPQFDAFEPFVRRKRDPREMWRRKRGGPDNAAEAPAPNPAPGPSPRRGSHAPEAPEPEEPGQE
ncbi:MAG TPA: hypothetical protein VFQ35_19050 [Polyangiaceae bacterium]|nr:hypothetical protein [Polyangiaceae bacterium]